MIEGLINETKQAFRCSVGLGLPKDVIFSRLLKFCPNWQLNALRETRLRWGDAEASIRYRFNRGDLQSIREIVFDKAYRLPFPSNPKLIVDLGANIGLASLWLSLVHKSDYVWAVEPDPKNAALARENLARNGVKATVFEAAIGPRDGTAVFEKSNLSNMGQVVQKEGESREHISVAMISMEHVLKQVPNCQPVDLVKMDIEGGEDQLLRGPRTWLRRVRAIIAELHAEVVPVPELIEIMREEGFQFIDSHSVFPGNMTAFINKNI